MIKDLSKQLAVLCIVILITTAGTYDFVLAEQRFIDHGNGTVTDRKLGLMWAKTDNQTDIFWNQIQGWLENEFPDTIPQLYDNWRLPTISELQSLYVEDPKYKGYQNRLRPPGQNRTPDQAQLYPSLDFRYGLGAAAGVQL